MMVGVYLCLIYWFLMLHFFGFPLGIIYGFAIVLAATLSVLVVK